MGKQIFHVPSTGFTTGTTAKTVHAYVAPAGGASIRRWGINFGGTDPTAAPIKVEILKGGSGGSGETSVTPVKVSGNASAVRGSANQNYGTNPSSGAVIGTFLIHPQSGGMFNTNIDLAASEMFEIRVTAAAAVTCTPFIEVEE